MSAASFPLRVVTPLAVFEREATSLRLRDRTGSFGILRGHADFLTILEAGLGAYRTPDGRERFLAVDGGLLRVEGGDALIASAEVFEGDDPLELGRAIDASRARRRESERIFSRMVDGLQREFLQQTMDFFKRGAR